ncbi:hypothetical protein FB45DRAFT_865120 [Roridomyces roridus]|uniref:Uncharacterized protein n=1 Tax=Roridomyces roridus TaxID=1738132 RepID=A0AAD7BYB5_9AGAR|nr:hypothetical protein FB45DRAFT_865120 [Roridomyces roridus]
MHRAKLGHIFLSAGVDPFVVCGNPVRFGVGLCEDPEFFGITDGSADNSRPTQKGSRLGHVAPAPGWSPGFDQLLFKGCPMCLILAARQIADGWHWAAAAGGLTVDKTRKQHSEEVDLELSGRVTAVIAGLRDQSRIHKQTIKQQSEEVDAELSGGRPHPLYVKGLCGQDSDNQEALGYTVYEIRMATPVVGRVTAVIAGLRDQSRIRNQTITQQSEEGDRELSGGRPHPLCVAWLLQYTEFAESPFDSGLSHYQYNIILGKAGVVGGNSSPERPDQIVAEKLSKKGMSEGIAQSKLPEIWHGEKRGFHRPPTARGNATGAWIPRGGPRNGETVAVEDEDRKLLKRVQ